MRYLTQFIAAALITLLVAGCSDWDDHYNIADKNTSATLWQVMQADPQLTDFCQVMKGTQVFRHHKRTGVSYAQLLDNGQAYTVFAPVNGTFNKDSLLDLASSDQGDSLVVEFFVKNHLAQLTVALSATPQETRLLNDKRLVVTDSQAGTIALTNTNIHARNGELHVVAAPLPYQYNIYEALRNIAGFAPIGNFLHKYDEDYFDEDASLSSGTVDGVPVYVDSVIVERNRLLQRIGYINREDSTYWMIAPTRASYEEALAEARAHFRYDNSVSHGDSIQDYWANRGLIDDAIFNATLQNSPVDSLISVQYNISNPKYHVFYDPQNSILKGTQVLKCSNGIIYMAETWPFKPEQTYFTECYAEGEWTGNIIDYSRCNYNSRTFTADSVHGSGYLDIVPATSTSNWNLTVKIDNTLAGYYDVCAVVAPKSVYNSVNPDLRPCKFKYTINYIDTLGHAQTYTNRKTLTSDPLRVDTVVLAEGFYFPACNFDQTNNKISVTLQCNILARETSKYNREMYLDCIYLRPRTHK